MIEPLVFSRPSAQVLTGADMLTHSPLSSPGFTQYTIALCHSTHEEFTNVAIELIN